MYKNQLQELAQRSCFNLPSYACIREGPDHAPRFKASVNFNGEIFDSPAFFSTLRQAEHSAAEVALNTLADRGPSKTLAAKVLVGTHLLCLFTLIVFNILYEELISLILHSLYQSFILIQICIGTIEEYSRLRYSCKIVTLI